MPQPHLIGNPMQSAETRLHNDARVMGLEALGGDGMAADFRKGIRAAALEADIVVEADERRAKTLPSSEGGGRSRRDCQPCLR